METNSTNMKNLESKRLLLNNPDGRDEKDGLSPFNLETSQLEPKWELNQPNMSQSSFRKTNWRWVVLILLCLLIVGGFFCYDNPNALSDQLQIYVTHGNDIKYNMLYSVYSYPNVIIPLIGGILIDKIGISFSVILFSSFIVVGQGIFTISGFIGTNISGNSAFIVAIIGRVVFGLGGEALMVWQATFGAVWFTGNELTFAFGLMNSFSSLGSIMNNYSTPPLAKATSLGWALMLGFFVCIISMICGVIMLYFEKHAKKIDSKNGIRTNYDKDVFSWKDIPNFNLWFWLIWANCVFTYIGILCFNNVSNSFFVARYGMSQLNASRITSNIFLISIVISPLSGYLCDKFGHKVSLILLAGVLLTSSHVLFLVIPASNQYNVSYMGILPILMLGIAYSIFVASSWSMLPLVVKESALGSAYGLYSASINIGLAIAPSIVGAVTNKQGDVDDRTGINNNAYFWVNVLLGVFGILAIISAIGLLIADNLYFNGILQKSSKAIQNKDESQSLDHDLDKISRFKSF